MGNMLRRNQVDREWLFDYIALQEPCSVVDLMVASRKGEGAVKSALADLCSQGRVYVSEWAAPRTGFGSHSPLYAIRRTGQEVDAPRPDLRPRVAAISSPEDVQMLAELRQEGLSADEIAAMFEVGTSTVAAAVHRNALASDRVTREMVRGKFLEHGKMSIAELEEHFDSSYAHARTHVRELRLDGHLFIAEWREPVPGRCIPVFAPKLRPDQVDAHEPIGRFRRPDGESDRDPLPQRVEQGRGLRQMHVEMARQHPLAGTPWSGL